MNGGRIEYRRDGERRSAGRRIGWRSGATRSHRPNSVLSGLRRASIGAFAMAALLSIGAAEAEAQYNDRWDRDYDRRGDRWDKPRVFIGGGLTFADPVGEFALAVDDGWGIDANVRVALDPVGLVSLRMDAGFLNYGNERQSVCISLTVGCRIVTDLVTRNNIAYLDAGPEIGFDLGPIRPYAGVSAGISYFATTSSLQDFDDYDYDYDAFNTTNFDDLVLAWRARTGLQVRVGGRRNPVYLDFGAVYHENGEAEYLTEGDIQDNADGSITVFPTFSEANLVTFQFGVSVGVGGGDDYDDDYDRRRRRGRRR